MGDVIVGASFARWRTDGKELFYRSLDGRLMAVSVATVAEGLEFGTPVALMPIAERLGGRLPEASTT